MKTTFDINGCHVNNKRLINSKDVVDLLVLSAHPDDGEFGLGGVLLQHGQKTIMIEFTKGENVTNGSPGKRIAELNQSTDMLELYNRLLFTYPDGDLMNHLETLSQTIIGLIMIIQPKIIFIPDRNDRHPDHRAVSYATIRACLQIQSALSYSILILEYLINEKFKPDFLIDTTITNNLKLSLLKLFTSQKRLQTECIQRSIKRETEFGKKINKKFAEGFRLVNYIVSEQHRKELLVILKIVEAIDIYDKLRI